MNIGNYHMLLQSRSVLFVIFIVTGILIINYVVMVESTERDAVTLNNNSEKMIISSFQLIDTGLKIHDNSYNNEMERELHVVMDAYNRSGGDPSGLDLMALKKQINGMGIYFINQSGVITHTTDQSEYLLNLSEIYPDFSVFFTIHH